MRACFVAVCMALAACQSLEDIRSQPPQQLGTYAAEHQVFADCFVDEYLSHGVQDMFRVSPRRDLRLTRVAFGPPENVMWEVTFVGEGSGSRVELRPPTDASADMRGVLARCGRAVAG